MQSLKGSKSSRRQFATLAAALAIAILTLAACAPPPGIGITSPYYGQASYNPQTTNFEGRMVACSPTGAPITVAIDATWGFDQVHPFRIDLKEADGPLLATRYSYQPEETLVGPTMAPGTCFEVQITSPGATGRSWYSFTVTW